MASSLVGIMINTLEYPWVCLVLNFYSIGSKKAAVLPDPVTALAMTSLP
jgi:hypothetical protein